MRNFRDKLLAQFKQHQDLIVAVDFDDTLCPSHEDYNDITKQVRAAIRRCNEIGLTVMVFTCRHEPDEVLAFLEKHGLEAQHFNESPIRCETVGFGKPYYNIFLDDKAGLYEALATLKEVLHVIEEGYDY